MAAGSRSPQAALAGSTAAFAIRLIILALPLVLAVALWSRRRADTRARGIA